MTVDRITGALDGAELRVGIVQSRFNLPLCESLRTACLAELCRLGVAESDTLVCTVPGALEIPTALLQLGRSGEFDVLIALGAVVKGDTYHFEVVCNESAAGVNRVALQLGLPIANAILTTYTDEQAQSRAVEKGAEAARVAVEMANLAAAIEAMSDDALSDDAIAGDSMLDDLQADDASLDDADESPARARTTGRIVSGSARSGELG